MANNGRSDDSLLQQTAVQNFQTLVNGFHQGSTEVKNLIRYESNLIVECRICRNFFRSLPSFITHKRIYCKDSAFEQCTVENEIENYDDDDNALPPTSTLATNDIDDDENRSKNKRTMLKTYSKTKLNKARVDNRNENSSKNASKFSLNILNRLVKRCAELTPPMVDDDGDDVSMPLLHYTNINRLVLPSRVENGVNMIANESDLNKLPIRTSKNDDESSVVTMVLPQDAAHRQHTMALRTRRNFDPEKTVKEIDVEEAKIYEKLEKSGSFDVTTLTCLIEKCGKMFKTPKSALFHLVYDHCDVDAKQKCYLCDDDDVTYDGATLKTHMEQHVDFQCYKNERKANSTGRNYFIDKNIENGSRMTKTNSSPALNMLCVETFEENYEEKLENICKQKKSLIKEEMFADDDEETNSKKSKQTPPANKQTYQQRELAKLSASPFLRAKRILKTPYDNSEFVSSLPKRFKRSPLEYSPSIGKMVRRPSNGCDGNSSSISPKERNDCERPTPKMNSSSSNLDKFPIIFSKEQKEQALEIMDYKSLSCNQCGARFISKCNLERHCYAHFGFVRFKCSKCDMGAFFRTELRRHLRSSCKNLKRPVADSLNDDELNNLILPSCPEEPGRITIWYRVPNVYYQKSFKGKQKTDLVQEKSIDETPLPPVQGARHRKNVPSKLDLTKKNSSPTASEEEKNAKKISPYQQISSKTFVRDWKKLTSRNVMKKYQGNFKKLNANLTRKRSANDKEKNSSADEMTSSDDDNDDNDDEEIMETEMAPKNENSPTLLQKREVSPKAEVKEETVAPKIEVIEEKTYDSSETPKGLSETQNGLPETQNGLPETSVRPLAVPALETTSVNGQQTSSIDKTQQRFVPIKPKLIMKPGDTLKASSVKVFTGSDGKIYVKPILRIIPAQNKP